MLKLFKTLKINLTIFQKLLIGIIALLILNIIVAYVGIISANKLEKTSNILLKESNKNSNLQNLKLNFNELLMPANDYLIHGNKVEILNFKKLDEIAQIQLKKSISFEDNHFNEHFLEEIEDILFEVEKLSNTIFELEKPIGNNEGAIMMEVMDGIVIDAQKKIDILISSSSSLVSTYISNNQITNTTATRIIISVLGIIIIFLLVGGYYYVKEITRPIKNLTSIAQKVTSVNSKSEFKKIPTQNDEIDNFSNLFNNMIRVLSDNTVSKDYMNSVLHKIKESLIITNLEGKIIIVNKSTLELLKYAENELIGKSINKVLLGEKKIEPITTENEAVQNIFNTYFSKSNEAIPVAFSKSFILDTNNQKTGILYLAYNQSERIDKKTDLKNKTLFGYGKIKINEKTPLTNREIEIIKLIVKDYSSQEIADKLFISIRTVETHRKNIMVKLHAKSTIGLVHYAIQNNLT
jgi:PAS domain S-box-containing protein